MPDAFNLRWKLDQPFVYQNRSEDIYTLVTIEPNAQALALMRTRHAAGSASALLGTSSFLIGAIASPLVGIAGEHTAIPMAVVQLAAALVAGACFMALCRPWNRRAIAEGADS